MTTQLIFILEIIGTIAFAVSGVLAGIERKMDILGLLVMAITTATGGGILRDLVLGITPPSAFTNPLYVEISVLSALVFLGILALRKRHPRPFDMDTFNAWMNVLDALGLGAFCVVGVNAAINVGYSDRMYLLIFVGTVTGVGGGAIRDVFCGEMPVIFRKRIYAVAAILGSWLYALLRTVMPAGPAMLLGVAVVVLIRLLATYLRWNLPVFTMDRDENAENRKY